MSSTTLSCFITVSTTPLLDTVNISAGDVIDVIRPLGVMSVNGALENLQKRSVTAYPVTNSYISFHMVNCVAIVPIVSVFVQLIPSVCA